MELKKQCRSCRQNKDLHNFSKDKNRKDGLTVYCKDCYKSRSQKYYSQNRDKILSYGAKWRNENKQKSKNYHSGYYQNNKELCKNRVKSWQSRHPEKPFEYNAIRRLRLTSSRFEIKKAEIDNLLSKPCFYCQQTQSNSLDHIIPLVRGGRHAIGNLIGACRPCNSKKQDKTIMEFRLYKRYQNVT
jgi:5-methylcytosine-specific restriction endonuclease McrA